MNSTNNSENIYLVGFVYTVGPITMVPRNSLRVNIAYVDVF